MMLRLQLFHREVEGTRDGVRFDFKIKGIPQIYNQKVFAGIELLFHFFRSDSRNI